jgi:MurNAc alpha-1-phosphate uridylyltransferase
MPDSVMLFAAGLGTRMAPLTERLPKPLIPVGGCALIDHALRQIDAAGVGRIVVNLHYKPEMIRAHLAHRHDIVFADETAALLETGGGLKAALPLLTGDAVYTMNTDAVWTGGNPIDELRAGWNADRMAALLLLVHRDQAVGYRGAGDFDLLADGRLRRGGSLVYTGAQVIRRAPVAGVSERAFSLNRVWDMLLAEGRVSGMLHAGGFCDVGRPESIALAEAHLQGSGDV